MGGPLRYSWWHERVWERARQEIGLPKLGFHDLRRVYASALVEGGVDVKVSQELMGHEDIRMTRGLYAQAGSAAKQRANDAIADLLLGPRSGVRSCQRQNLARTDARWNEIGSRAERKRQSEEGVP